MHSFEPLLKGEEGCSILYVTLSSLLERKTSSSISPRPHSTASASWDLQHWSPQCLLGITDYIYSITPYLSGYSTQLLVHLMVIFCLIAQLLSNIHNSISVIMCKINGVPPAALHIFTLKVTVLLMWQRQLSAWDLPKDKSRQPDNDPSQSLGFSRKLSRTTWFLCSVCDQPIQKPT